MNIQNTARAAGATSRLRDFPITEKWPAEHPDLLQLYSVPTPNGLKVAIALKEMDIPYEYHPVSFSTKEQKSPEFMSLNPNGKIPAIIDPNGPDGTVVPLWESGAILIYLAEKSGRFLSTDPVQRHQTIQWLMFQMGGLGPMVGQLGYFNLFDGAQIEDKRALQRYVDESRRLIAVLDSHLDGRDWLMDDYSIADIATAPWIRQLVTRYQGADLIGWPDFKNAQAYLDRFLSRPAVQAVIK